MVLFSWRLVKGCMRTGISSWDQGRNKDSGLWFVGVFKNLGSGLLLFATVGTKLHSGLLAGYFKCNRTHSCSELVFLSSPLLSSSSWNTEDQNPVKIKYMNLSAYVIIIHIIHTNININYVLGLYFLRGYDYLYPHGRYKSINTCA